LSSFCSRPASRATSSSVVAAASLRDPALFVDLEANERQNLRQSVAQRVEPCSILHMSGGSHGVVDEPDHTVRSAVRLLLPHQLHQQPITLLLPQILEELDPLPMKQTVNLTVREP
jgi:hypothetical protein